MIRRLLKSISFVFACNVLFSQAPTAAIVVPSTTICTNQNIIFSSISTNTPTSFNWTISPSTGVNFITGTNQPTIGITFSYQGVYSVSLTVTNATGSFVATQNTTVSLSPRASFSASLTTTGFPNQLVLTNFSSNADNYIWSYSETPSLDNTANTIHNYSASGSYTVTLTALSNNGCADTASYSLFISDSSGVTLPNVFTPNSDDVNDVFKPIARGIKSMNVFIYSRNGNLVASWNTVNGHWDGRTTSGIACESGTYFCVVEATGFDGKDYKLKGFITLFK